MDPITLITEALRSDVKTVPQYLEYEAPALNEQEWMRYAGIPVYGQEEAKATPEIMNNMEKALELLKDECFYRVSFLVTPITRDEDGYPILPFAQRSDDLRKNLEGCGKAVLFAATVGAGIDRLIRRYEKVQPELGLMLQGLGAERVESLCDTFNADVTRVAATKRRFSPGYGDLPIEVQKEFLTLLEAEKRLGITLSESCLMAPSKSVTAIIGICD